MNVLTPEELEEGSSKKVGRRKMASLLNRMMGSLRIGVSSQVFEAAKVSRQSFVPTLSKQLHTSSSNLIKRPDYAKVQLANMMREKIEPKWDKLLYDHLKGKIIKRRPNRNPLGYDKMVTKGVVIKTTVRKPRKPNSGNRKCVLLRLKSGKELTAFVPGEGHNLQEHNVVLIRNGRLRDCPGVKTRCIRGRLDLAHVQKPSK